MTSKNKVTVDRLKRALDQATAALEARGQKNSEPIAIVGEACRFPGAATPEAFWELLAEGRDATGEIPADRWDAGRFYSTEPAPGKMYTRRGGFLPSIDTFDAEFFGITPREAGSMDPQQRLLLELSWEAIERAGIAPSRLRGTNTGVFVGVTANDYSRLLEQCLDLSEIDGYFATGNALNSCSGRISFVLGLQGPSLAVDTACSSSLAAVHLACQSLRLGECDLALACGVNLIVSPEISVAISQARMLSPDGRCKTFSANADGYGRGEGCGIVLLERLSDALRSNRRILALIRGSAMNQDGSSSALTVPNGPAQQTVIRRALQAAGIPAHTVGYLEAHGTGTALGDPIELGAAAGAYGDRQEPLWIGSVKANIGHLEAAAGIAGMIKAALALQQREIPPHLFGDPPNPLVPWAEMPIRVARLHSWPSGPTPRRAAVSSFGASGTNVHVILEEAPDLRKEEGGAGEYFILPISAKTWPALHGLCRRYTTFLAKTPRQSFGDVCFTAATGRDHMGCRLALTGSYEAVCRKLAAYPGGAPQERVPENEIERLACSYEAGENVDWQRFYSDTTASVIPIPTYPFEGKRFWPVSKSNDDQDVFYEIQWRSKPLPPRTGTGSAEVLDGTVPSALRDLITTAQTLAEAKPPLIERLVIKTRGAVSVLPGESVDGVDQSPVWGLVNSINLELPHLRCTAVDLESQSESDDIRYLAAEVASDDGERLVAYRSGQRFVARLVRKRLPSRQAPLQVRSNASYLITGGLSGLGLASAAWLVRNGARHLVLIGRRPPDETARFHIERMEEQGAIVRTIQADVTDFPRMQSVLKIFETGLPALCGIVHAAGVLADAMLINQTWAAFEKVLAPKVSGALNLHELTRNLELDFFVLYSSVAGLLGSPAQANHAAACAFLNSFSAYRRARNLPALSVAWGPWSEIGAAAGLQERNRAERMGFAYLSPEQALTAMSCVMRETGTIGVLSADWQRVAPRLCGNLLAELAGDETAAVPFVSSRQEAVMERLRGARSPAETATLLTSYLQATVRQLLSLDSEPPVDKALIAFGFDSLLATELKNRVAADLAADLPLQKLLAGISLDGVAEVILEQRALAAVRAGASHSSLEEGTEELAI